MNTRTKDITTQALTGSSLSNLLAVFSAHKFERSYWSKLAAVFFWSALVTPLYWLEDKLFSTSRKSAVHPETIFIIGHWRSGTTYLHYLLAKDKQFGYCSNADAFIPGALFTGRWLTRKILALRLPRTRPMDNVKLHVDDPQEEEFAMMLLTPYSAYYTFVFPRTFKELLMSSLIFNPNDHAFSDLWKDHYHQFLKKLSYRCNGKRLLLKNPANTARISQLTQLFPDSKFIYLHRDPKEVKLSTIRMFKSMIKINTLQEFPEGTLSDEIENIHLKLLNGYEQQKQSIRGGNLIEIEYTDLITNPLTVVRSIYETLGISGFEKSQPEFEEFIEAQKSYVPHHYMESSVKA